MLWLLAFVVGTVLLAGGMIGLHMAHYVTDEDDGDPKRLWFTSGLFVVFGLSCYILTGALF